jgi:hypothetical protein
MTKFSLLGFFLFSFMLLGACNVFDPLYSDTGSNDFEKTLANAEAAMKRDDYNNAVSLYKTALGMRTNSSVAMVGLASAILLRDVEIKDIPALMNSVFNIDLTNTQGGITNSFVKGDGISDDIKTIAEAASNAAWWRAPVSSIDRVSGKITVDGQGLPYMNARTSDGVIAATNANAILNYVIIKTLHITFEVQKQFELAEDLRARIDVEGFQKKYEVSVISNAFAEEAIEAIESGNPAGVQALDAGYKAEFKRDYAEITNARAEIDLIRESIVSTHGNTSSENLMEVAEAMVRVVEKQYSDNGNSTVATVKLAIADIKEGLSYLKESLRDGGEIDGQIDALDYFINEIEEFAAMEIDSEDLDLPGPPIPIKTNWLSN